MARSDEALQQFIDEHHGRLVGLLRLRGTSPADAEDLAQEAMLRLVQNWEKVADLDQPWLWLVRVALNLSHSRWRRLQTAVSRRHLLAGETTHYDEAAVEALELLEPLTIRQRTAVVLRYYTGLSVREAAEAMGVAEGTVKSLCAKGLRVAADHHTEQHGTSPAVDASATGRISPSEAT